MKYQALATIRYGIMAVAIALSVSPSTVTAQDEAVERSLEGVWEVTMTPRNCTTGEPIPPPVPLVAQYTFSGDGKTISWYSQGTPSTGHGLWRREHGWGDYSFRVIRLLRTATGTFSGKSEIGGTVTLSESGDQYTSDEYMIVYDINGVPGTPSCINSFGTRFKLEP